MGRFWGLGLQPQHLACALGLDSGSEDGDLSCVLKTAASSASSGRPLQTCTTITIYLPYQVLQYGRTSSLLSSDQRGGSIKGPVRGINTLHHNIPESLIWVWACGGWILCPSDAQRVVSSPLSSDDRDDRNRRKSTGIYPPTNRTHTIHHTGHAPLPKHSNTNPWLERPAGGSSGWRPPSSGPASSRPTPISIAPSRACSTFQGSPPAPFITPNASPGYRRESILSRRTSQRVGPACLSALKSIVLFDGRQPTTRIRLTVPRPPPSSKQPLPSPLRAPRTYVDQPRGRVCDHKEGVPGTSRGQDAIRLPDRHGALAAHGPVGVSSRFHVNEHTGANARSIFAGLSLDPLLITLTISQLALLRPQGPSVYVHNISCLPHNISCLP